MEGVPTWVSTCEQMAMVTYAIPHAHAQVEVHKTFEALLSDTAGKGWVEWRPSSQIRVSAFGALWQSRSDSDIFVISTTKGFVFFLDTTLISIFPILHVERP